MKLNKTNVVNTIFYSFILLLVIAVMVAISNRWFIYNINVTHSLNGLVYVIHKGEKVEKGNYVGFRWKGDQFYKPGSIFVKIVSGVPGDEVTLKGRMVFVNDKFIGIAKEKSERGIPLEAIKPTVIKEGEIFVSTPAKDGYDSRYERVGLIKDKQILGKAYEIF
ncbi:S26 family signal peptidase (plasmid) [Acinetobacter seifertii]|uniref:S26 family signal peptidase n=1 Tax=Acinetobacter seifertii TaxID=1530123 RepID=UPI00168A501E|nr:S26 family signal peptidase [Acinetobacter seifertii]QNX28736.1 S26 family signal peptidase [Acinetobacter seifertii]